MLTVRARRHTHQEAVWLMVSQVRRSPADLLADSACLVQDRQREADRIVEEIQRRKAKYSLWYRKPRAVVRLR